MLAGYTEVFCRPHVTRGPDFAQSRSKVIFLLCQELAVMPTLYYTIISFLLVFRTSDWGSPNATNYFGPIASEYPNETTCAFRAFRADAGQPDEYMVSLHVRFYNSFYYYFPKHASSFNKIMKSFFSSKKHFRLTKLGFTSLLPGWRSLLFLR